MSPLLTCALSIAAFAEGADQEELTVTLSEPDEIIVTGERVRRLLRETPSSVTVISDRDIQGQAAPHNVEQILALVANVQLGSGGQGPSIRGQDTTGVLQDLPAFLGGNRPRATLQVDGRVIGYNEFVFGMTSLWDVEQAEVFRTPQTTVQGPNSIAGAIILRTKDPSSRWEARFRGIAGDFATQQGSAVLSGPIATNQLSFRATADFRESHTTSTLAENMRGADPNKESHRLLRLKVRGEPAMLPGLNVLATYVHSASQSPQIVSVREPFKDRRDPFATYGVFGIKTNSLTVDLTQSLSAATELSALLSTGKTSAQRFAPPGLGEAHSNTRDWSLEASGRWRLHNFSGSAGVHAFRATLDQQIDLTALRRGNGTFYDRQDSLGLYLETTTAVAPQLSLTAGARYQRDNQQRTGVLGYPHSFVPLLFGGTFSAFLPKMSVTYYLADRVTVGFLVQRAYNPGGATLVAELGEVDTFNAEHVWNYEVFFRGTLDRSLTISSNLFYNAIRDAQRPLRVLWTAPNGEELVVTRLDNAPAARSYGAETEAVWMPTRRLTVRTSGGLLWTRLNQAQITSDPILGKQFSRSPNFTGSAQIDWQASSRVRLSSQVRHHSRYFSNDINTPALRVNAATIISARASYTLRNVTAFAYVRNLLDSFHLTYLFSSSLGTAEEPRMVGFGLETKF
jgi:iron complex outermembrane recepter protein